MKVNSVFDIFDVLNFTSLLRQHPNNNGFLLRIFLPTQISNPSIDPTVSTSLQYPHQTHPLQVQLLIQQQFHQHQQNSGLIIDLANFPWITRAPCQEGAQQSLHSPGNSSPRMSAETSLRLVVSAHSHNAQVSDHNSLESVELTSVPLSNWF